MKTSSIFYNYITGGIPGRIESEKVSKAIIINLFGTIGFLTLSFFIIRAFFESAYFYSFVLFLFVLFICFLMIYLRKTQNPTLPAYIIVSIMFLLELFLLVYGTNERSPFGTLWYYVMPPLALFVLGRKVGSIYIVSLVIITVIMFKFPPEFMPEYPEVYKLRLLFTYTVVYALSVLFEFVRQMNYRTLTELNKQLEKLSIAASETDNAITIADKDGNIQWINQGFTKLFGYSFEEFINEKGNSIIEASSNPDIQNLLASCLRDKSSVVYSYKSTTKQGKYIYLQTTLTPILDENQNIKSLVAIDSDITVLKLAESEILQQTEEILTQKEEIEAINENLSSINNELEIKNIQIVDSINYAKLIQEAILPSNILIKKYFPDSFVFFKPKDIVSGDFYWFYKLEEKLFIAVVDCTGHGVPGAFMSMIGYMMLNDIIKGSKIVKPSLILEKLNEGIENILKKDDGSEHQDDGMDLTICCIDNNSMHVAGTRQGFYIIQKDELIALKGDIFSIGSKRNKSQQVIFTDHSFILEKDTYIYMLTDGYIDQFGGINDMKFMSGNFKKMIGEIHKQTMQEQLNIIDSTFESWRKPEELKYKEYEQIDDVLVIGIKVQ